ncbi:MAG: ABC transporter ATP-binding protein [Ruthenibacterium lactatiformans]
MEMNLPVIKLETRNLTKKFSATEGVADISLQVYEHELLTLLGPSGCGKTTILRAIGGFNKIDSGKILLDGAEVQGLPPEKRPTGMVFQSYNLWPHMTIYENMAFGLKLRKTPKKEMDAQIAEMLALVKMSGSEKPLSFPAAACGRARALVLRPPYACWTTVFGTGRQDPRPDARGAQAHPARAGRPSSSSRTTKRRPWPSPTALPS